VSVYILEDLQDAMRDTLRNFSHCAGKLTPRGAPTSRWSAYFEVYELSQVMLEYIEGREHLYRAMGVLPRYGGSSGASPNALRVGNFAVELPPTEISVHVLAAHPLGRDYRQDPLTVRSADKLSLSETDDSAPKPQPAAGVRAAWKSRVEQQETNARTGSLPSRISSALRRVSINLPSRLQRDRRRSEFAREMMMLPLSLKNPDLSVTSGGAQAQKASARRKARSQARTDAAEEGVGKEKGGPYESPLQRRLRRGPERYYLLRLWQKYCCDSITCGVSLTYITPFCVLCLYVVPQVCAVGSVSFARGEGRAGRAHRGPDTQRRGIGLSAERFGRERSGEKTG
jgi:hypothetical protein